MPVVFTTWGAFYVTNKQEVLRTLIASLISLEMWYTIGAVERYGYIIGDVRRYGYTI